RSRVLVPALGRRRRDRARRRHRGRGQRRPLRAGRGPRPRPPHGDGRGDRGAGGHEDRGPDLRLHQRRHHGGDPGGVTIHLGAGEELRTLDTLTPREIVAELDRHVVGQAAAKRAVAVALRNRIRRQKLPPDLAAEVVPKNILMIGPTGVGKTEIARRLARLSGSPFLKVEASKFTEVGYVGRDVESMVRDLTEAAVDMVRREKRAEVQEKARRNVEEQLLDLLLPPRPVPAYEAPGPVEEARPAESFRATREKLREQLRSGQLDSRSVEVEVRERSHPSFQILSSQGVEEMDVNMRDLLPGLFGGRTRKRRLPVPEARDVLLQEEENRLVEADAVARIAVERVQSSGILFID